MNPVKRFIVFAGRKDSTNGGWDDFVGSFDTLEEARAEAAARQEDGPFTWENWTQVVDLQTGQKVA
jgi:hypothetical protein